MTGQERILISGGKLTSSFFENAIVLSGKENPTILFDSSASTTTEALDHSVAVSKKIQELVQIRASYFIDAIDRLPSRDEAYEKISGADILYVDGGSTSRLQQIWARVGIAEHVTDRVRRGQLVAAGASAGALIWFDEGHSDSMQYEVGPEQAWQYRIVPGTSLLPGRATVHYSDVDNQGRLRADCFRTSLRMPENQGQTAIGIETDAAIMSHDGIARVLKLKDSDRSHIHEFCTPGAGPSMLADGEVIASLSIGVA